MKYIFLFLALSLALTPAAQPRLSVIKASSRHVSINDGGYLDKDAWNLNPKLRPMFIQRTGPGKRNG